MAGSRSRAASGSHPPAALAQARHHAGRRDRAQLLVGVLAAQAVTGHPDTGDHAVGQPRLQRPLRALAQPVTARAHLLHRLLSAAAAAREEGVDPQSSVETFVAMKLMIDNWRWQGVPFYIRSGKRMEQKVSEIAIVFKPVPHSIFAPVRPEDLSPNILVLKIQPEEGIGLHLEAKTPGPKLCMNDLSLNFSYQDIFGSATPNAYERLLLDCMTGDQTLFVRNDAVELSWQLFMPVLEAWERYPAANPLRFYFSRSWGPREADDLLAQDGRQWR